MGRFGLYAALAPCICGLPTTAEERFERWSLEQPGNFIFALSFKRPISFDDRTATSELAFVCNQEEKYVAVLLIPLDGTFADNAEPISLALQEEVTQVHHIATELASSYSLPGNGWPRTTGDSSRRDDLNPHSPDDAVISATLAPI